MIDDVLEFHQKFELPDGSEDKLTNDLEAIIFRTHFIQEELIELKDALAREDRIKAFDALLDLAYVVYGTALFMGVTPKQWHAGMGAVHAANMSKVRAQSADESKRGSAFDVVKPKGWQAPEPRLEEILNNEMLKTNDL